MLVARGNHTGNEFEHQSKIKKSDGAFPHTDFFIELDHENGPITLHSSLNNVVKYVQAGIQKLRRNVNM